NPFRRNNAVDTFTAILREDPPPLDPRLGAIPVELTLALGRALAKKPDDRYPTARELAADLREVRARVVPPVAGAGEIAPRERRGAWALFGAIGAFALAVGAFLLLRGC
ncbi:MAG TPA: hypothetical protein VFW15_13005, partial [Thermoanaerobaculia bacterium]|nr:hypothetical protein [Thermoanaerobaculia bacterium]